MCHLTFMSIALGIRVLGRVLGALGLGFLCAARALPSLWLRRVGPAPPAAAVTCDLHLALRSALQASPRLRLWASCSPFPGPFLHLFPNNLLPVCPISPGTVRALRVQLPIQWPGVGSFSPQLSRPQGAYLQLRNTALHKPGLCPPHQASCSSSPQTMGGPQPPPRGPTAAQNWADGDAS